MDQFLNVYNICVLDIIKILLHTHTILLVVSLENLTDTAC